MKFSLTTKLAAASGLTALLLGGLVPPVAQADPVPSGSKSLYGQLSGGGSDTTQDVMNGLQISIGRVSTNGDWKLASYDANLSTATIQTKSGGSTAICRPNGSSNGLRALNVAIGADDTENCTPFSGSASVWNSAGQTSVIGQIQFARSSSGPTIVDQGVVAYVPFAKDAMGYAVSDNSVMPELIVGSNTDAANGSGVTPSSLWAIYNCSATRIITKAGETAKLVDNTYTLGAGESSTRIRAYLPQSGSGTASFWQGASGAKFGSVVGNCVERKAFVAADDTDGADGLVNFTNGADYSGISVQEHSGQAVDGNAGAITPFSIPKWIAMAKAIQGVTDVRYDVVIGDLNGIAPTSGDGADLVINPDYVADSNTSYLTRTVYNLVPYRTVTDPTSLEHRMFNGRTSLVCSNAATIRNYGFSPLTATSGVNSCGDVSQRAVQGTTPQVSTTTATLDNVESDVDFAVTGFVSNGTAGAKVYVLATSATDSTDTRYVNEATPATIAAGSTSTTFELPYSALPSGSWKLGLVIVPNLPGILNYSSANDLVTKTGLTTTVSATVTGKVKKFGTAVITVAGSGGTPTGTVTVHKGTSAAGAVIGTATLTAGTATITTLPKQKKKAKVKLFVVYSGDGSYAGSTRAVTWNVK